MCYHFIFSSDDDVQRMGDVSELCGMPISISSDGINGSGVVGYCEFVTSTAAGTVDLSAHTVTSYTHAVHLSCR